MTLPVMLKSTMPGAPKLTPTNGSLNALLYACLVNGFNTVAVTSATASGGVVTFNFASSPGFSASDTITVAGASNATVNGQRRVQSASGTQVLVAIAGVPDGAVAGSITMKFSPLGWTRPYSTTGTGCYRQGGTAAHKRYFRLYDNNISAAGWYAYVRGYENMTAHSTGTGPFPTTAQISGNGHMVYTPSDVTGDLPSSQHRPWVIIGTPRFFVVYYQQYRAMYPSSGDTEEALSAVNKSYVYAMAFGDPANIVKAADTYACMCMDYRCGTGTYTPRLVAGTGTSAEVVVIGGTNAGYSTLALHWPSAADGGIHFSGYPIVYDVAPPYGFRGTIPGALCPLEAPFSAPVATPMDLGTILTGIPGVTGRIAMFGHAGQTYSDVGWLLDEDWGDV